LTLQLLSWPKEQRGDTHQPRFHLAGQVSGHWHCGMEDTCIRHHEVNEQVGLTRERSQLLLPHLSREEPSLPKILTLHVESQRRRSLDNQRTGETSFVSSVSHVD